MRNWSIWRRKKVEEEVVVEDEEEVEESDKEEVNDWVQRVLVFRVTVRIVRTHLTGGGGF